MKTVSVMATLIKETEKAVLLKIGASYKRSFGEFTIWVPKSGAEKIDELHWKVAGWKIMQLKEQIAASLNGIKSRVKFSHEKWSD